MSNVCEMPPQNIDYSAITHLICFSGEPIANPPYFNLYAGSSDSATFETGGPGWCYNPASNNNTNGITHQSIMRENCRANGVKFILCIGGDWGTNASNFQAMIADTAKQDIFIQTALGYARRHGFDGIDIDWEWPVASLRERYSRFLRKVRAELDTWSPQGILSMAVGPEAREDLIDPAVANETVDQMNVICYGLGDAEHSAFNSAMARPSSITPYDGWTIADHGPLQYVAKGFQPEKLGLLMPFEAKKWIGVDGPGQPRQAFPSFTGYAEIVGRKNQYPASYRWDDEAKVPWLGFVENGTKYFYSYDDSVSLGQKIAWVNTNGLGGVGIWDLGWGWVGLNPPGQRDPLLQAVKRAMAGNIPPPPANTLPATPILISPSNGAVNQSQPVTLQWSGSSNTQSYHVQIATNTSFGSPVIEDSLVTSTSFQMTTLDSLARYYWRVSASNSNGASQFSAVSSFTTGGGSTSTVQDLWIYRDNLQTPWIDASWNSTNTFISAEQKYAGSYSLKSAVSPWGALSFHSGPWNNSADVNGASYTGLSFRIFNTVPGFGIRIFFENDGGSSFPSMLQYNIPVNEWTEITLPMSQMNPSQLVIHRLVIQNNTGSNGTYYIDDLKFVGTGAQPPPPSPPPVTPVLLSPSNGATGIDTTVITLRWRSSNGASSYALQMSVDSLFRTSVTDDSMLTDTTRSITGLEAGSRYFWRVRARNGSGNSNYSEVWNFTTVSGAPEPSPAPTSPTLLSPVNNTTGLNTPITLRWSASAGATSYSLQASQDSAFQAMVVNDSGFVDTSRSVGTLAVGTKYFWRVRAQNAQGSNSDYSLSWNFTTAASAPPPSTSDLWLYKDALQSPWINASWSSTVDYSNTAQKFAGTRSVRIAANAWGALRMRSGPYGSPTDISPSPYSGIEFYVYAITTNLRLAVSMHNDRGQSFPTVTTSSIPVNQWVKVSYPMSQVNPSGQVVHDLTIQNNTSSTKTFHVDNICFVGTQGGNPPPQPTIPPTPTLVSPASGAANQPTNVTLSWNASSGATNYRVQLSADAAFSSTVIDDSSVTTTSRQASSLAAGTTYYWRVSAKNSAGSSAFSTARQFSTSAPSPNPSVTVLTPNGGENWTSSTTQNITWSSSAISHVNLSYKTSPTGAWQSIATNVAASNGSYGWTIPNTSTTQARVRIANAADAVLADSSDADFSITTPPSSNPAYLPAVLRDNFNAANGALAGRFRWVNITNMPSSGSMAINTNAAQATVASGGTYGGILWDTLMSGGTEMSVIVRQKSNTNGTPNLFLYGRMSNKDFNTGTGYRVMYIENSGTDVLELQRIGPGYSNDVTLASVAREVPVSSSITFRVLNDNRTMVVLIDTTQVLQRTDSTYRPAQWYFAVRSRVNSRPFRIDDFKASTQQSQSGTFAKPTVEGTAETELQFSLEGNYPNPFNPVTDIRFQISEVSMVSLKVYDVLGREVVTLVNEQKEAGSYSVRWDASVMPSGVYFYRMEATGVDGNKIHFRKIRKMLLVK